MPVEVSYGMVPPSNDFLESAANMDDVPHRKAQGGRLAEYERYHRYYDGDHPTRLLSRQRSYLQIGGVRFCENVCDLIVDTYADRLRVKNMRVVNGDTMEDIEEWSDRAKALWEKNLGDDLSDTVHRESGKLGDAFTILDTDEYGVCIHVQQSEQVKTVYSKDNPRKLAYAVKKWCSDSPSPTNPNGDDINRMNIYYEDRIEKYYSISSGGTCHWYPHIDEGEAAWPTPWVDGAGEPLGIPVYHFANKRGISPYGVSEIRKAIPMQDAYNKHILDVFEVADQMAFPQRWATGVNQSETSTLDTTPGTVWTASDPQTSFGQFNAADMTNMLSLVESDLKRIASMTRTPLYSILLDGAWPSGEALKSADAPLVNKVLRQQAPWGNLWEQMMLHALRLEAVWFGGEALPDGARVVVDWEDPHVQATADMLAFAEGAVRLGASQATGLRLIGIDNAEEELEISEKEKEAQMDLASSMLIRGIPPSTPTEPPVDDE